MSRAVVLDAGPLGKITHPKVEVNSDLVVWYKQRLEEGATFVVPEIADYEVRRELLRVRRTKGVQRLDRLASAVTYLPITHQVMRAAAQLWADMRNKGLPTATPEALDADVILAAQAKSLEDEFDEVVIATDNVGHLNHMVAAKRWSDI